MSTFILSLLIGILWGISSIMYLSIMDIKGFILTAFMTILWFVIAKGEWKNRKGDN